MESGKDSSNESANRSGKESGNQLTGGMPPGDTPPGVLVRIVCPFSSERADHTCEAEREESRGPGFEESSGEEEGQD